MFIIRGILGALILFFDWVFTPKGVKRTPEQQTLIQQECESLTLYQYKACPFCVKVRRAMKRQSLPIKTRDAKRCDISRNELIEGGGKLKVPCLQIKNTQGQTSWMYESSNIIAYLEERFSGSTEQVNETQPSS